MREEIYQKIKYLKEKNDNEEYNAKLDKFIKYLQYKDLSKNNNEDKLNNFSKINKGLSVYEKFLNAFQKDLKFNPDRLMGLTDGIFGMVMTLLIFGMSLPEIQINTYNDFLIFLTNLAPTLGLTVVSFILISTFWIYHHEFIKLNNLNLPYLWINIMFLITISFIPFTTSLIGNYSHFFASEVIFGVNIFLTLIFFTLMYYYAYKRDFLEKRPSKKEREYTVHTLEMIMLLTIIINLLDFNVSSNFIYLYILVPIISTFRDIHFKMNN